jgi:hypothetical protein
MLIKKFRKENSHQLMKILINHLMETAQRNRNLECRQYINRKIILKLKQIIKIKTDHFLLVKLQDLLIKKIKIITIIM